MSRPERITAIWAALSPAGRDRAWAALDEEQRVDALAILLDAAELHAPEAPVTFASAYDAWQRRAER